MKHIKYIIAVLATAALTMVASNASAADFPAVPTNSIAVRQDNNTHVQVYPASYKRLLGFTTNQYSESFAASAGTNFIARPDAPFQYISTNPVTLRFVHATNTSSSQAWAFDLYLPKFAFDRTFTVPATWIWPTNLPNETKITTLRSNVDYAFRLTSFGGTIHITGAPASP